MASSKVHKRLLIIISILAVIVIIVIFSINLILASLIEAKINASFEKNKSDYKFSIDDVGGNIFFGNIRLKGLMMKPDSLMIHKLEAGELPSRILIDASIPLLRVTGISIYDVVAKGQVHIKDIEIKKGEIKLLRGIKPKTAEDEPPPEHAKSKFNVDSIYLEGINGFSLKAIILEDNLFTFYDVVKDKEILKNEIEYFEVTNLNISPRDTLKHVFKIDIMQARVTMKKEVFTIPGGLYRLSLDRLEFTRSDSSLVIKKLAFKPTIKNKFEMARQYKYTQEIFDLHVDEIEVRTISISDFVRKNRLYVDSVIVDGVNLEILKDKRYPFDESKRPKLPHQSLKAMNFPMYVGTVVLANSKLLYQEKEEGVDELMTVKLGDLGAKIHFITSVKDSMRTGKPMDIRLKARLMEQPQLNVNILLPLNSRVDTFFFSGSLGAAKLKLFNSASLPAIGAKFISGQLNSIEFKGSANPTVSTGEMTMLYEDLEGEVVKKDHQSKSKFLSWAANSVLKKGNPGKNGNIRVAVMGFDRVMYKGFGNFIWKTLQSGITNTVSPVGKVVKEEKPSKEEEKAQQQQQSEETKSEKDSSKKKKKERKRNKKDRKNNKK